MPELGEGIVPDRSCGFKSWARNRQDLPSGGRPHEAADCCQVSVAGTASDRRFQVHQAFTAGLDGRRSEPVPLPASDHPALTAPVRDEGIRRVPTNGPFP